MGFSFYLFGRLAVRLDVKFHGIDQIHLYESDTGKVTQPSFAFSWLEWNEVV